MFESPRGSGNWYKGRHEPLITKELWDKAQEFLKRDKIVRSNKEFTFTKLLVCGYCGSGISAEEKYKDLKNGTQAKYIYYGCGRPKDRNCKNKYIQEPELISELLKIIDKVSLNEIGIKAKMEEEIKRFNIFQRSILNTKEKFEYPAEANVKNYVKYILKEGSKTEKREVLGNLRSRITYKDKELSLVKNV